MTDTRVVVLLSVNDNDWFIKMSEKWFLRKNGWIVDGNSAISPNGNQFQVVFEGPSRLATDVRAGLAMMRNHINVAQKQHEEI